MKRHRVRRGVVLTTAFAATLLIAPLTPRPVTAQHTYFCRTEKALENRLRRVRGRIMVECGNECPVWPLPLCHSAPFGNWGVDSIYGPTTNDDQFRGWKNLDGHGQWNSCTANYRNDFNDGPGQAEGRPRRPRVRRLGHLVGLDRLLLRHRRGAHREKCRDGAVRAGLGR